MAAAADTSCWKSNLSWNATASRLAPAGPRERSARRYDAVPFPPASVFCTPSQNVMPVSDSSGGPVQRAIEEIFYPAERIPLVEWREFSGAKPTVALTAALAILSFVTGLSNLSQSLTLAGPLAGVLADSLAESLAQLGGVLFAFALGVAAVGLQRRKRLAWLVAVVAIPALATLPLITFQPTDVPLLLAIAVTFSLHVRNRNEFRQSLDLSPLQIASLSAIFGVVLYGTIGSYGLREQFRGISTWGDAFYFVIVTIATVGYGDITPTSLVAKWFSLSIILFGTGAFTVAVGALIGPAIRDSMAGPMSAPTATVKAPVPKRMMDSENHLATSDVGVMSP